MKEVLAAVDDFMKKGPTFAVQDQVSSQSQHDDEHSDALQELNDSLSSCRQHPELVLLDSHLSQLDTEAFYYDIRGFASVVVMDVLVGLQQDCS